MRRTQQEQLGCEPVTHIFGGTQGRITIPSGHRFSGTVIRRETSEVFSLRHAGGPPHSLDPLVQIQLRDDREI